MCANNDQSCPCLCLLLHQLWNTNACWKMTPLGKGEAQGPQQAAHTSMSRGCQGQKGGKCWEKVLWLVRALNSHCTLSFGKHTLSVDTDFSTGWPGGVGRGRAKVFYQVWALLAGRMWEGTGSHTEGTLVTAAVSRCPTPHPAQHPAGTGAAPTAPNFRTSITALT